MPVRQGGRYAVDFLTTEQTEAMADSPVDRMSFRWHDIFTLMKQTRNYPEKAEVITDTSGHCPAN